MADLSNKKDMRGFTLTEVMIGMMILVIAIVSATNLLIGLIDTNKNVVRTLQAYYFAQEGVEAIRNIRDTNWLNNIDFQGDLGLMGRLDYGGEYVVNLRPEGFLQSMKSSDADVTLYKPWQLNSFFGDNGDLCLSRDDEASFYSNCSLLSDKKSLYKRYVTILKYCEDFDPICEDSFLVKSTVKWQDGAKDREISVQELLTNWKGGVL